MCAFLPLLLPTREERAPPEGRFRAARCENSQKHKNELGTVWHSALVLMAEVRGPVH